MNQTPHTATSAMIEPAPSSNILGTVLPMLGAALGSGGGPLDLIGVALWDVATPDTGSERLDDGDDSVEDVFGAHNPLTLLAGFHSSESAFRTKSTGRSFPDIANDLRTDADTGPCCLSPLL
ncbi:MAG: hypothetical protein U0941_15985 [Planctomycetaceae bacterium]